MVSSIVRLLRLASFLVCVIVLTSFAFFAVDQTKSASTRQRESVGSSPALASAVTPSDVSPAPHHSPVRRAIDHASHALTAPFAGVISPSEGEWAVRSAELLLALRSTASVSATSRGYCGSGCSRAVGLAAAIPRRAH